jgi:hypothetical protein
MSPLTGLVVDYNAGAINMTPLRGTDFLNRSCLLPSANRLPPTVFPFPNESAGGKDNVTT